jgi:hypothetical protein
MGLNDYWEFNKIIRQYTGGDIFNDERKMFRNENYSYKNKE